MVLEWTYNDNDHLVLFDIVFRILSIIHVYQHISQLLIQIFLFLLLLFRQIFLVYTLRTSLFITLSLASIWVEYAYLSTSDI